jgi:hypothetical protein
MLLELFTASSCGAVQRGEASGDRMLRNRSKMVSWTASTGRKTRAPFEEGQRGEEEQGELRGRGSNGRRDGRASAGVVGPVW